jgi:hypothetical protein
VIKHTDKAEYVREDLAALPRHPWNQSRRWAALHGREREREREEIVDDDKATTIVTGSDGPAMVA